MYEDVMWKSHPYQQWHGDNITATEYGELADFTLSSPVHPNLPYLCSKTKSVKLKYDI
jgi:hypothetical protein